MEIMKSCNASRTAKLIGFQTREPHWFPGFVSPIFVVGKQSIIQTPLRLIVEDVQEGENGGRVTPYPTVECVTFCETYYPRRFRYTAYWDTERLWVTLAGQFQTSLHPEDIAQIQANWKKLKNPSDLLAVQNAWARLR